MVDIRPKDLPAAILPLRTGDAVIVDQGADGVRQTNPIAFTDSVAPVASQSEAQSGTDNTKRMTSLRTKQSIASEVGVTLASNSQGAKADSAVQSVNDKTGNAVSLDKNDIGLGNADNTSDSDKPVSTATQTALNAKANSSVTVAAGAGLAGGGDLTANRSLALNSASIASLAKADTSVQTVNGIAPTGGNVSVAAEEKRLQDTRTTAISESFASNVQFVETSGYSTVGDGDALYVKIPSPPSHAGWFQSSDGGVFAITKRTVKASQFGASASLSNNAPALNDALAYLKDIGGGCLELDTNDEYITSGTVGLVGFTDNIIIENTGGGVIRAAPGMSTAVMSFRGNTSGTTPSTGKLSLYGVRVNNQDGNTPPGGGAACTGLDVNYIDYLQADDYECYGGELPQNTNSDSGISTVAVRTAIINNARIRGQGDVAIYPNWDNTGTVDGYFEVNGGHFSRNQGVLAAKRNLYEVVWRGGLLLENRSGLTTQWVDNGGWVHPARNMHVSDVTFRKTLANCIQMKGNSRLFMSNCRIIDVGYEYDGSGNVGANARAISLQGSRNCKISNVYFEMSGWASNLEYAFSFSADTTGGGNILPGNNVFAGSQYRTWYRTVIGGNVGDPNLWTGENYPVGGLVPASDQNSNSVVKYNTFGDKRDYTRIGVNSSNDTFSTHILPITHSLSAVGTIAANTQSSVQSVTVAGLLPSDNVHITRLTATIANNAGISISARPVAGSVQFVVRNSTSSSVDLSDQSIRLSF